jgi:hypothetical protein
MKRKPCSLGWTDHAYRRLASNNFCYGKRFFALRRQRNYKTLAARIAATFIPKEPF